MLGLGCNKRVAPPTPLPIEQLPSALQKAFSKAKPDVKGWPMKLPQPCKRRITGKLSTASKTSWANPV
jgi:hypothetical protein